MDNLNKRQNIEMLKNEAKPYDIKINLVNRNGIIPTRNGKDAAGYDLYSTVSTYLQPYSRQMIGTGIALEIPPCFHATIHGRSGLAFIEGVTAFEGVIDSDYRGEIQVLLFNTTKDRIAISQGQRIAQLVFTRTEPIVLIEFVDLSKTNRGKQGFGSSGK